MDSMFAVCVCFHHVDHVRGTTAISAQVLDPEVLSNLQARCA